MPFLECFFRRRSGRHDATNDAGRTCFIPALYIAPLGILGSSSSYRSRNIALLQSVPFLLRNRAEIFLESSRCECKSPKPNHTKPTPTPHKATRRHAVRCDSYMVFFDCFGGSPNHPAPTQRFLQRQRGSRGSRFHIPLLVHEQREGQLASLLHVLRSLLNIPLLDKTHHKLNSKMKNSTNSCSQENIITFSASGNFIFQFGHSRFDNEDSRVGLDG